MITLTDTLIIVGLFVLRLGVPAAVIAGLVYLLKRLDRQWEQEAQAQRGAVREIDRVAEQASQMAAAGQTIRQPAVAARAGQPAVFEPIRLQTPGIVARGGSEPCWNAKNCPEKESQACAARQHPEQACWQARFQAEGKIPDQCPTCEIFQRSPLN
ncbi:MAG TPA: hypothetical protein VGA61_00880 [Anaerolineae bacterium]